VRPEKLMTVERYSHVMHLVSSLRGTLREDVDCFDALMSCFPAGTVSALPKCAPWKSSKSWKKRGGHLRRGILYLDFAGNLDSCIALRTMVIKNGVAHIQAAGHRCRLHARRRIRRVGDKSKALLRALESGAWRGRERKGKS